MTVTVAEGLIAGAVAAIVALLIFRAGMWFGRR